MPTNGYWIDLDEGANGEVVFIGQTKTDPARFTWMPRAVATRPLRSPTRTRDSLIYPWRVRYRDLEGAGRRTLNGIVTFHRTIKRPPLSAGACHSRGPELLSREKFNLLSQVMAAMAGWCSSPTIVAATAMVTHPMRQPSGRGTGTGRDVMSGVEYLNGQGPWTRAHGGHRLVLWRFMTTWLGRALSRVESRGCRRGAHGLGGDVRPLRRQRCAIESTGASPYIGNGMAINRRQSPSSSMTKIKAATLIMCDTGDFRVPIAQSFGLYRALIDNKVTTEFYAIPTAGHFPGDPVRQMDVYQRWIDWLQRYLP